MKVKKKHLTGEIADFPLHVVQVMVDEQVRQGNPADPSVFAERNNATQEEGGFDWGKTNEGDDFWSHVIELKRFQLIPKPGKPKGHVHAKLMKQYAEDAQRSETPWEKWEYRVYDWGKDIGFQPCDKHPAWLTETQYRRKTERPTPNEVIRAMLDKGMVVWASVSDSSYDEARGKIGYYVYRIVEYDESDAECPMRTKNLGWMLAVPVDIKTMAEITEMPK